MGAALSSCLFVIVFVLFYFYCDRRFFLLNSFLGWEFFSSLNIDEDFGLRGLSTVPGGIRLIKLEMYRLERNSRSHESVSQIERQKIVMSSFIIQRRKFQYLGKAKKGAIVGTEACL